MHGRTSMRCCQQSQGEPQNTADDRRYEDGFGSEGRSSPALRTVAVPMVDELVWDPIVAFRAPEEARSIIHVSLPLTLALGS